jgi:hypothetical protein
VQDLFGPGELADVVELRRAAELVEPFGVETGSATDLQREQAHVADMVGWTIGSRSVSSCIRTPWVCEWLARPAPLSAYMRSSARLSATVTLIASSGTITTPQEAATGSTASSRRPGGRSERAHEQGRVGAQEGGSLGAQRPFELVDLVLRTGHREQDLRAE